MRRSLVLVALLSGVAPATLHAQSAPQSPPSTTPAKGQTTSTAASDDSEGDIVITGSRKLPGSVVGDIPPEQTLSPADIRSYGVSSIGDLLNELSPQTRSDRGSGGMPVILLSGRRISSFAELRDLPTEAIARVEILPEEVALKYGYRADQRVVNFVLRRRFKAITAELGDTLATDGGRNTPKGSLDVLTINGQGRFSLHTEYSQSSPLYESERDITALPSNFDPAGTILPGTGSTDGQVDPALSALAGKPVTYAGVPVSAAGGRPTLASFVPTANTINGYDQGQYRTLLARSRSYITNAVLNRVIFGNVSATLNGSVTYTDSTSAQGLAGIGLTLPAGNPYSPFGRSVVLDRAAAGLNPLEQNSSSLALSVNGSLNGDIGKWRWNAIANYDRSDSETLTDRGLDTTAAQARLNANDPTFNPFGTISLADYGILPANRSHSVANTGGLNLQANGPLFHLPAGDVTTSLTAIGSLSSLDSDSYRNGLTQANTITRDTATGRMNVDVPVSSRSKGVLPFIGDLSLNGNVEVEKVSNFRTLTTTGYGANWSPIDPVRFLVSVTDASDAPSALQLGNPTIVTPNVRVFDFVTGQTVNISQTTGGNPLLKATDKHTLKVGLTVKPFDKQDLTLTANYVESNTRNDVQSFPSATAAVEAAFPGRFVRDGAGNLLSIDARPVNFARSETSELRWGINYSIRLKSKLQKEIEAWRAGTGPNPFLGLRLPGGRVVGQNPVPGAPGGGTPPGAENGAANGGRSWSGGFGGGPGGPGGPPGGGGPGGPGGGFGGGGGRGGFGGGPGGGGGRLQMAFYHTWHFTDRVLIAQGVPEIDLLNGGALGAGGQARHELEGQLGYNNNGIGVRFSADWKSGTEVQGGTAANPETLDFSSLGTVNMRLFADLGQQLQFIKKNPWAIGMRVVVGIDNLFNTRQKVRDASGDTPISYQPDYLDPLGRTIRVSVRKLFF